MAVTLIIDYISEVTGKWDEDRTVLVGPTVIMGARLDIQYWTPYPENLKNKTF